MIFSASKLFSILHSSSKWFSILRVFKPLLSTLVTVALLVNYLVYKVTCILMPPTSCDLMCHDAAVTWINQWMGVPRKVGCILLHVYYSGTWTTARVMQWILLVRPGNMLCSSTAWSRRWWTRTGRWRAELWWTRKRWFIFRVSCWRTSRVSWGL